MTIGLLFGTFNPIHNGHIQVAQSAMFNNVIDQVWFMVTPQSPFKKNLNLISKEQRLEMVRLALDEYDFFQASDFEFSLSYPQYTFRTLQLIQKNYPEYNFVVIMGSDNYISLSHSEWKESDYILDNFKIYVYGRNNDIKSNYNYIKIPGDFLAISSSEIREKLSEKKNMLNKVTYLEKILNKKVLKYIQCHHLYLD